MRWALVVLVIALATAGADADDLMQGVKTEKPAYGLGEKVACQYSIQNTGSLPVTYSFTSSKQFDLWVTRGDENELFRLSNSATYSPVATSFTLCAGESRTFCAEWNQKDRKGNQVGPGAYTICAQLTPTGTAPPYARCKVAVGGKGAALAPVTIKQAILLASQVPDSKVSICATYRGWSPSPNDPNTREGPPVTRSDWAICDATGCMYVVGGIDLNPSKDNGTPVSVVGRVKKNDKGQVYLVLQSATVGKKPGG